MSESKYLVLIETSSNQSYIFSSNRLRENIGASELIYRISAVFAKDLAGGQIENIIAPSGKALFLVSDTENSDDGESIAKDLIEKITEHALRVMPGLTVHGAICQITEPESAEAFHKAVGSVHRRLDNLRFQIPSNQQRFQRLPFVAQCASNGLPASEVATFRNRRGTEVFNFSKVTMAKRQALASEKHKTSNDDQFKKPRVFEELEKFGVKFPKNLEKFEDAFPGTKWLAIVHADGNGLGQIYQKFEKFANMESSKTYRTDYREFSDEIDKCTKNAFGKALAALNVKIPGERIPVIPLILGGDDLTFICDGEYAINLTKDFLRNFESENSNNPVIQRITRGQTLGICAGIVIIKPHFPFHQAYQLAEELLQSAKKVKDIDPSLSALDYHVLYDSSGTKLESIREKTPFVARPYLVTPKETAEKFTAGDKDKKSWIVNHHIEELSSRVAVMQEKEDGKSKLPNSQLHVLREGLYLSQETGQIQREVDARARLIAHRYDQPELGSEPFKKLYAVKAPGSESLFFEEKRKNPETEETKQLTHFLDALDVVELWK